MYIKLDHLTKQYGATSVLDEINAQIEEGEFFVLVGPSGSGKSTLLRIIAGLIPATSGDVYFDNQKATDLPPKDRRLAIVFQNYALLPFMSVAENIRFGLHNLQLDTTEEAKRVNDALAMVQLTELRDRKPKELSGGQQQRVALARAIATKASLVLMDEPLSNLDAQLRTEMRQELVQLHKELGMTLLYVTHDQVEAMTMGERIMVLNDHHVQQVGTPLDLYNHPANEFVASFIGSPKMNMFDATIDALEHLATLQLTDANQHSVRLPLPFDLQAGAYQLGIRPEKIQLHDQPAENSFPVRVMAVANLGRESSVTLVNNGHEFIASVPEQYPVPENQIVYATLPTDAADLHFFDEKSGFAVNNKGIPEKAGVLDGIA
jgi:sn-glycerol 3-phosphate transport system ATP-binding protein